MFGMVIDTGPKFYILTMSVFAKLLMDLIHVWLDDRNLYKILRGTITPVHD